MSTSPRLENTPKSAQYETAFQRLWLGSGLGMYSQATVSLTLPLLALNLQAGAVWMGALTAARWVPWLAVGLLAGAWIDRLSARRVMVVSAAVTALALLSVPLTLRFGTLHLTHLLVLALVLGLTDLFTQVSRTKLLAQLTPGPLLEARNARLFGTDAAMQLAGQGSAGPLMQWLGQQTGFMLGSGGQALAALALFTLPRGAASSEQALKPQKRTLTAEIVEGWRVVFRDQALRAITLISAVANFGTRVSKDARKVVSGSMAS